MKTFRVSGKTYPHRALLQQNEWKYESIPLPHWWKKGKEKDIKKELVLLVARTGSADLVFEIRKHGKWIPCCDKQIDEVAQWQKRLADEGLTV
jgi:hypothetical protein